MALLSAVLISSSLLNAQQFDLLIKGGHVIDPRNDIDGIMDVAIAQGKISRVAANIAEAEAEKVVNAEGFYVTPGLVDIHGHVFYGTEPDSGYSDGYSAIPPDGFTLPNGVTTIVDLGGAGWRDFRQFKEQVIDRVQTRVLAFLNIVGSGMKGGPVEQNLGDMDPKLTAMRIREYPDILVGVKVAHYQEPEWIPVDRAVRAGGMVNVPVAVDFGHKQPPLPLEELLLNRLRPGDMLTHCYAETDGRFPIVGPDGKVKSFVFQARERGVLFDVGHGAGSFVFRQAVPAMKQGFPPDSISTDMHASSVMGGMKNMTNLMSKFLNVGMSLKEVVLRTTWNPAQQINRSDLGHLSEGAVADVAVLNLRRGDFGFVDVDGGRLTGDRKLECELTVRAGEIVWDLNGISSPPWDSLPRITP